MNLLKPLVTDRQFWGRYEGNWLSFKDHYPNGPAFGGLIGAATAFSVFLQDQLREESALLNPTTKRSFETQQQTADGKLIPMTLGWHRGLTDGVAYLYKEGGGGGCHNEMRIYPQHALGTIFMSNNTEMNTTRLLNRLDRTFLNTKL